MTGVQVSVGNGTDSSRNTAITAREIPACEFVVRNRPIVVNPTVDSSDRTHMASRRNIRGFLVFPGAPLLGAAVLCIVTGFVLRDQAMPTRSVDDVRKTIVESVQQGGFLGPFALSADRYDVLDAEFIQFGARTDGLMVGAERATITVDASADTVQLDLFDAVIMRVPDPGSESTVSTERLPHYVLGPFPYNIDIIESPVEVE